MKILSIPDNEEAKRLQIIRPGLYVCEDVMACELYLMNQSAKPEITHWNPPEPNGKKRRLVGGGMGFGDALMLTPCLREMKKRFPDEEIIVCCRPEQVQVFLNLPFVDGFLEYPPRLEILADFGTFHWLEGAVEYNPQARVQHMTDRFAAHLGLFAFGSEEGSWTENRMPEFALSSEEIAWAFKTFPREPKEKRLAFQVQAGARCRTYPPSMLTTSMLPHEKGKPGKISMFSAMVQDGWKICLLGSPGEFRFDVGPAAVIDMTRMGLTFRQSAAFMQTCDCFLGSDSSLLHVAGTLGVPGVGLFGPYPRKIRTAYYPSIRALTGKQVCPKAPCFHSAHTMTPQFPVDGPCAQSGRCEELASIEPDRIRAVIEKQARPPMVPAEALIPVTADSAKTPDAPSSPEPSAAPQESASKAVD